jgi:hypothetical protein
MFTGVRLFLPLEEHDKVKNDANNNVKVIVDLRNLDIKTPFNTFFFLHTSMSYGSSDVKEIFPRKERAFFSICFSSSGSGIIRRTAKS